MTATWWLAGVALALGCSCSPYGGGAFACTSDPQCSPGGVCAEGFCAFPDQGCMSGYKYGELSGSKSNTCVGDTTPEIDAPRMIDADMTPTPDGASCYGSGIVHPCFANVPSGNKVINAAIDTMNSPMCSPLVGANANAWCVIAGATVSVQGTVAVTGARPLVLVSTGVIQIQGTLDAASHRGGTQGPASDAAGCNAGTAPAVASGGAGGSFGGLGGTGAVAGTNGTAGMPGAVLTVTALRGGCPGQAGAGGGGGAAGHGGGAVYLIAGTSITVSGTINVSGSSGINANASSASGGGGGGAGGYIGLEAASVMSSGNLFANGGGGGEASGSQSTGNPGTDSTAPATGAIGGNGGSAFGTDGGNGSQGATLTGAPGAAACTAPCGATPTSGGGGGGGAGIIKIVPVQTLGGAISPPTT